MLRPDNWINANVVSISAAMRLVLAALVRHSPLWPFASS